MAKDLKKAFENSFKGYHKDAPAHLHAKSKALHKAGGTRLSKAVGLLRKHNNNWEDKDTF
jgi:hypothetical protein